LTENSECADEWNEFFSVENLVTVKDFPNETVFTLADLSNSSLDRCGHFSCSQRIEILFGTKNTRAKRCTFNVSLECAESSTESTTVSMFFQKSLNVSGNYSLLVIHFYLKVGTSTCFSWVNLSKLYWWDIRWSFHNRRVLFLLCFIQSK